MGEYEHGSIRMTGAINTSNLFGSATVKEGTNGILVLHST